MDRTTDTSADAAGLAADLTEQPTRPPLSDEEVRNRVIIVGSGLGGLAAAGADAPDWDAAWLTYRRHFLHGLLWFLCPTQMQPVEIINASVERFALACTDHDVATLF